MVATIALAEVGLYLDGAATYWKKPTHGIVKHRCKQCRLRIRLFAVGVIQWQRRPHLQLPLSVSFAISHLLISGHV